MKNINFCLILILMFTSATVFSQGCEEPSSDEGLNFFGFIQSQYEMEFTDPIQNSFTFERARLGVTGNIPYDFSYYAVLEMSPFIADNPYLLDAFISYKRFKWLTFSIGSFKTPFSLDINTPCHALYTIYRSRAALQMIAPMRDLGFMILGGDKQTKIQYSIGIMNGTGLGKYDINKSKDLVARLLYRPVPAVQLGGNFRYGKPSRSNDEDERITYGAEMEVNYGNFLLRGEYIGDQGEYNREAGGGCSGDLLELGEERSGAYVLLGYMTPFNLQPVFRYEYFDTGNTSGYREDIMTYGINYFFNDWTRLQINYLYKAEDPVESKNDALIIQLQVKF